MKVYTKWNHPPTREYEHFSVDVITLDENELLNLAYYDYEAEKWVFHADTLVDPADIEFVWMYAPKQLLDALKSVKK